LILRATAVVRALAARQSLVTDLVITGAHRSPLSTAGEGKTKKLFAALVIALFVAPLGAQQPSARKPITHDVYDGWKSIQGRPFNHLPAELLDAICDVAGRRRVFPEAERVKHFMNEGSLGFTSVSAPGALEITAA
jgi:hypothetical protein